MFEDTKTCEFCCFSITEEVSGRGGSLKKVLFCRRNPPSVLNSAEIPYFPSVGFRDWCGEYKPNEQKISEEIKEMFRLASEDVMSNDDLDSLRKTAVQDKIEELEKHLSWLKESIESGGYRYIPKP